MRRAAWGLILAATLLLGAIWRLQPTAPPLYDGICIADPYRALDHSPPPSSASTTYPGSPFPTAEVSTTETPSQAQILMMSGTFSSPSSVTVSVNPVAPRSPPPPGLRFDGNTYRITAVAGGQTLQPQSSVTVVLRGAGDTASLTMYADTGGGWQQLRTFNLGCGYTFEAVSPKVGYFALFASGGGSGGTTSSAASGGGGSSGGFPVGVIVGVIAAVIVVATIALARFSAGRRR